MFFHQQTIPTIRSSILGGVKIERVQCICYLGGVIRIFQRSAYIHNFYSNFRARFCMILLVVDRVKKFRQTFHSRSTCRSTCECSWAATWKFQVEQCHCVWFVTLAGWTYQAVAGIRLYSSVEINQNHRNMETIFALLQAFWPNKFGQRLVKCKCPL